MNIFMLLCMEEDKNDNNIRKKNFNLIGRRLRDIQDLFDILNNTFQKYRLSIYLNKLCFML